MALNLTPAWSSRRAKIITALLVVGLLSYVAQVARDDDLSATDALIGLGTEGLKTALLFILIDLLIADHEQKAQLREGARMALTADTSPTSERINELLDQMEDRKVIKAWSLAPRTTLAGVALSGRHFRGGRWSYVNLQRAEFTSCTVQELYFDAVEFGRSVVDDTTFQETVFANRCDLTGAMFNNCTFAGCTFIDPVVAETRFVECTFDGQSASFHPLTGASYVNCVGVDARSNGAHRG